MPSANTPAAVRKRTRARAARRAQQQTNAPTVRKRDLARFGSGASATPRKRSSRVSPDKQIAKMAPGVRAAWRAVPKEKRSEVRATVFLGRPGGLLHAHDLRDAPSPWMVVLLVERAEVALGLNRLTPSTPWYAEDEDKRLERARLLEQRRVLGLRHALACARCGLSTFGAYVQQEASCVVLLPICAAHCALATQLLLDGDDTDHAAYLGVLHTVFSKIIGQGPARGPALGPVPSPLPWSRAGGHAPGAHGGSAGALGPPAGIKKRVALAILNEWASGGNDVATAFVVDTVTFSKFSALGVAPEEQ